MSFFVNTKTQIKNLEALKMAFQAIEAKAKAKDPSKFKNLDLTLTPNLVVRGHGNNTKKTDLGIRLEGKFDLGFIKSKDGCYDIVADSEWLNLDEDSTYVSSNASYIASVLGKGPVNIKKEYVLANMQLQTIDSDIQVQAIYNEEKEITDICYGTNDGDVKLNFNSKGDPNMEGLGFKGEKCEEYAKILTSIIGDIEAYEVKEEAYVNSEVELYEELREV